PPLHTPPPATTPPPCTAADLLPSSPSFPATRATVTPPLPLPLFPRRRSDTFPFSHDQWRVSPPPMNDDGDVAALGLPGW
ncbi:hypothetical protein Tsubulata_001811, partial [Turnera subulata]